MKTNFNLLILFFSFGLFLGTGTLSAQTKPELPDPPYIEVTGTAEKEVIPDEIYISITLREKYENKVKITVDEQEQKLRDALKGIGVNLNNLYVSDLDADYVKIQWRKKDVITKKEYTLKVGDASTAGKVFTELDKLGINDAYISKVNHSHLDSLLKEVRIMAIKAAKTKADYLLGALGEKTGKTLIIREQENFTPMMSNVKGVNKSSSILGQIDKIDDELEFQKIKVSASIYVRFGIK